MKKDLILKDITKEAVKEVLKNILNMNVDNFEFLDFEFPKIEKRDADILIKTKENIIHIEFQSKNDKNMHLRMARYFLEIYSRYNINIYQYVLFIGKEKVNMKSTILTNNCKFEYEIIDLKTIPCDRFLKIENPQSLVLAILCDFENKNPKDVIKEILHKLYKLSKNENEFRKYLLMLEELSTSRNLKEEVKEAEVGLQNLTWEDLPSFEIGFEKGIQQGEKRGEKIGEKKGITIGKVLVLKELGYSNKEISDKLKLPQSEIEKILKDSNG
ncbi:MAG: hypothetical protein GXO62_04325 [Epsilonproteobacteria bacterium]|nr:hypothetical protein [Campylobacterota bacterium]